MNTQPGPLANRQPGTREAGLLLIAAGFALLMMDFGEGALIAGCGVVTLWLWTTIRGPRPSPLLTIVYGAGVFVTCFWWPREGWWPLAIALTWIGIAFMFVGSLSLLVMRVRASK